MRLQQNLANKNAPHPRVECTCGIASAECCTIELAHHPSCMVGFQHLVAATMLLLDASSCCCCYCCRVLYSSATGASTPTNMAYMARLLVSGACCNIAEETHELRVVCSNSTPSQVQGAGVSCSAQVHCFAAHTGCHITHSCKQACTSKCAATCHVLLSYV
jgi:hypothetical protein